MIEALAPHGADEAFPKGILPRTAGRRENFRDAHVLDTMAEPLAVDLVAIPEEIGWRGVFGEGVHDLPGRPGRGGMLRDVEVDDAPALVGEHDEDEEHPQARGGHREEVEGDQVLRVSLLRSSK